MYTEKIPLKEREPFVLLFWRAATKENGREMNHIKCWCQHWKSANSGDCINSLLLVCSCTRMLWASHNHLEDATGIPAPGKAHIVQDSFIKSKAELVNMPLLSPMVLDQGPGACVVERISELETNFFFFQNCMYISEIIMGKPLIWSLSFPVCKTGLIILSQCLSFSA